MIPESQPSSSAETSHAPSLTQDKFLPQAKEPFVKLDESFKQLPLPVNSDDNKENIGIKQESAKRIKPIFITGSGLNSADNQSMIKFIKLFGANKSSRFIPGVTSHVVMNPMKENAFVVGRTYKYFMGILNHVWIVNTDWIRESLKEQKILDEDKFEIAGDTVCGDSHGGPKRSRITVPLKIGQPNTAIFAHMNLCAYGTLPGLVGDDFARLVECGSGTYIASPAEMPKTLPVTGISARSGNQRKSLIIVQESDTPNLLAEFQQIYSKYHIPFVSIDWFFNCISLYRRLAVIDQYYVYPKKYAAVR